MEHVKAFDTQTDACVGLVSVCVSSTSRRASVGGGESGKAVDKFIQKSAL